MDATVKTTESVHRVKRPYVRKSVPALEGAEVGVQYDDEVAVPHPVNVARVEKYTAIPYGDGATGRAFFTAQQIYAMRVWGGQSVDVPVHERLERVRNALNGQNLPHDGVSLDGHKL